MDLLNRLQDRLLNLTPAEPAMLRGPASEAEALSAPAAGGLLGDRLGQLVVLNLEELTRWAENGDTDGLPQVKKDVELLRDLTRQLRDRTEQQSQSTAQSLSAALVAVGHTNGQLQDVRQRQQQQQAASAQQEAQLNALHQQINGYEVNRARIQDELESLRKELAARKAALQRALDEWWNIVNLVVQGIRSAIGELTDLITGRDNMLRRIEEDMWRANQDVQRLYSERGRLQEERHRLEELGRQLTGQQMVLTNQLNSLEQQQKALSQRVVLIENVYSFLLEMYDGLAQMSTSSVKSLLRKLNSSVQYYDLNGQEETCTFNEALQRIVRDAGHALTGSGPLYTLPLAELTELAPAA